LNLPQKGDKCAERSSRISTDFGRIDQVFCLKIQSSCLIELSFLGRVNDRIPACKLQQYS